MYSQLIYMHPEPSRTQELLKELKERNETSNAEGFPHLVAQHMYGPEPTIISVTNFDDLAALEKWYDENATQPSFRESAARISATLTRPTNLELSRTLVRLPDPGVVKFFLSATCFNAAGKMGALRKAMEAALPATKTAGATAVSLHSLVAPEAGAACTVNIGFATLGGLQESLEDPSFGGTVPTYADLLVRPIRQRLYRVLMPFGG